MLLLLSAQIAITYKESEVRDPKLLSIFNDLFFKDVTITEMLSPEFKAQHQLENLQKGKISLSYSAEDNKNYVCVLFENDTDFSDEALEGLAHISMNHINGTMGETFAGQLEDLTELRPTFRVSQLNADRYETD